MKKLFTLSTVIFVVSMAFYLSGCVNYEQKTKLENDGSGTMKIHYWTKSSNISSGEVQGFGFTEEKVKANYGSGNTEVSNIKIEEKVVEGDTTKNKHVTFDLKFKDLNKLNEVKGFKKTKSSWKEGKEGMDFEFILLSDTSSAKSMGSGDYKLNYEFEFPSDVISTNGNKAGANKVEWFKTVADLKEDIKMTATVKSDKKKCGLFGLELPIIILTGLSFFYVTRKKFKK